MTNLLIIIQVEDVYGIVSHACCTSGRRIFDANMLKAFPLTFLLLNIIRSNGRIILSINMFIGFLVLSIPVIPY